MQGGRAVDHSSGRNNQHFQGFIFVYILILFSYKPVLITILKLRLNFHPKE